MEEQPPEEVMDEEMAQDNLNRINSALRKESKEEKPVETEKNQEIPKKEEKKQEKPKPKPKPAPKPIEKPKKVQTMPKKPAKKKHTQNHAQKKVKIKKSYLYAGIDDPIMRGLFEEFKKGKDVRSQMHQRLVETLPYFMINESNYIYAYNPKLKIPFVNKIGTSFQVTRNLHEWSGLEKIVISPAREPTSFQPNRARNNEDFANIELIYNGILKFDSEGKIVPDLAESVDIQGKNVKVKLRNDVKWHDGHQLTSEDVIYSINFLREDTDFLNKTVLPLKITKIDKFQFEMEFKEETSSIPFY